MNEMTYELAPRSKRFLSVVIDSILGLVALAFFTIIIISSDLASKLSSIDDASPAQQAGFLVGMFIFTWLIFLLMHGYLLATRGQTIGKYFTKIRIVNLVGSTPSLLRTYLLRYILPNAIYQIPILGAFVGILNPLFIFKKNRRCLHDYIAGTQVIEATGTYAIITNTALRIIGGVSLSISILTALWARAHSPNMGFGEAITKLDSYILNQPIYYTVLLAAGLFAVGGAVCVILSFKETIPSPPNLPISNTHIDDLIKAQKLFDSGAIDASEYQKLKDTILNK